MDALKRPHPVIQYLRKYLKEDSEKWWKIIHDEWPWKLSLKLDFQEDWFRIKKILKTCLTSTLIIYANWVRTNVISVISDAWAPGLP